MQNVAEACRNKLDTSNARNSDRNERPILIVEDDDDIGSLLVDVISQETPYHVLLVADGLQALQIVQKVRPCLLITDYRLPFMNGIELYDRLRAQNVIQGIPTIMISARLPAEEEVKKRHMVGINKPFELDELLWTVGYLLDYDCYGHHQLSGRKL